MNETLIIRHLPKSDYHPLWHSMQRFTDKRDESTLDEIWLLEHTPVFTQGLAGKAEHVLDPHNIPVVQTDRGGQVTYHGPGQLMLYALVDLRRKGIGARALVCKLEQTVIDFLASLGITAKRREKAPGVYVGESKICSIGLRVRRGSSYHGIAFNVDTDLTPFRYINPCGFRGLEMTQVKAHAANATLESVAHEIIPYFMQNFGYTQSQIRSECVTEPA